MKPFSFGTEIRKLTENDGWVGTISSTKTSWVVQYTARESVDFDAVVTKWLKLFERFPLKISYETSPEKHEFWPNFPSKDEVIFFLIHHVTFELVGWR